MVLDYQMIPLSLKGRGTADARNLETAAIQIEQSSALQPEEADRFNSAEAYEQRLLSQIAGEFWFFNKQAIIPTLVVRERLRSHSQLTLTAPAFKWAIKLFHFAKRHRSFMTGSHKSGDHIWIWAHTSSTQELLSAMKLLVTSPWYLFSLAVFRSFWPLSKQTESLFVYLKGLCHHKQCLDK